ncbi:MAG: hypothetical protein M3O46_06085 [Myxococcota bacterium]|nr:hypothetical protein [Myxococcota bacterium]
MAFETPARSRAPLGHPSFTPLPCSSCPHSEPGPHHDKRWSDAEQKAQALRDLVEQVDSLERWILKHLPDQVDQPPLSDHLATLRQIREQDLEPDPAGGGWRIRQRLAAERRVSVEDAEMRHGRKSKSKRFNGYKRHIAADLDKTAS